MQSLIGDRFLKRFFGSRLHRRRVNPVNEVMTLPANETDKPDEPCYTTRINLPDTDANLENEQRGEIHQLAGPENGSDQPTADDDPISADVSGFNGIEISSRLATTSHAMSLSIKV